MKFGKVWFVDHLPELVFEKFSAPVAVQNVSDAQDIDEESPIENRPSRSRSAGVQTGADSDTDSPTQE